MVTLIRTSIAALLLSALALSPVQAEDKPAGVAAGGDQASTKKKDDGATNGGNKKLLRDDHPERYTVVPGDTLWDIAARFLKSPWMWPKIWKVNTKTVKNPHLIYPGDVILLRWVGGDPVIDIVRGGKTPDGGTTTTPGDTGTGDRPIVRFRPTTLPTDRLSPRIRTKGLETAIPTIPPNAINAFLTRPRIVTRRQMRKAGYITVGLDNRLILGNGSEFYARGIREEKIRDDEYFYIFRRGKPLRGGKGAKSRRVLAYESVYLGEAQLIEKGDPAKLVVTKVKQEILPTDRLLISPKHVSLPYYYPKPPIKKVKGSVIHALNSVSEIGPYTIVVIDLGSKHGMEPGTVLRVDRHVGRHRDPVRKRLYRIPDEQSGVVMVFKAYKNVSYALVMTATQPIRLNDTVVTP